MKKIKITYEKKMSNECWDRRVYITNDGKDGKEWSMLSIITPKNTKL